MGFGQTGDLIREKMMGIGLKKTDIGQTGNQTQRKK